MLMFAVSFGPSFLTMDLTTQALNSKSVTISIVSVIVALFFLNWISVVMLTDVYRYSKLGSYQEVAYVISQGNRGYIYLISVMKTMYCVLTAAFCLEYCISYTTILIRATYVYNLPTNGKGEPADDSGWLWQSYLIYYLLLILFSVGSYYSSKKLNDYTGLLRYSSIMFITICISVGSMIFFSFFFAITGYSDFMNNQLSNEGFNIEAQ
mmetsp:Transcript_27469/g.19835  ORF Transcript_27469/g.19835 Transcript_27469/m.19835 type:complete len:209 (-) Transcript_27469:1004-1630(-)